MHYFFIFLIKKQNIFVGIKNTSSFDVIIISNFIIMKLYPLNLSRLNYLDSGQFIVRYLTDFSNSGIDVSTDADFKALHNSLVQQSPLFNDALMQIRAQAETIELIALDQTRDKKVTTLRRALSVFENSDTTDEQAAYQLIKITLTTYKDIDKVNYEAESLGIDNLIAELRNASHIAAVQALGIEVHINNLETANTNFKNKFNTRSTEAINTIVYDTKALRKAILETYKELAEYILVMAKRRNTAYYLDILKTINNGREYFATILARHNSVTSTIPPTV